MTKRQGGRPLRTTDAEFVAIWERSDSIAEVARITGYKRGTASWRATKLRRAGHSLKSFVRGATKGVKNKSRVPPVYMPSHDEIWNQGCVRAREGWTEETARSRLRPDWRPTAVEFKMVRP